MDIEESWNMAEVEEANVPQVNGFLIQHRRRDHATSDHVPRRPEYFPVLGRRNTKRRRRLRWGLQEGEEEGRALK